MGVREGAPSGCRAASSGSWAKMPLTVTHAETPKTEKRPYVSSCPSGGGLAAAMSSARCTDLRCLPIQCHLITQHFCYRIFESHERG